MATNPTLEGDGTALYISNLLAGSGCDGSRAWHAVCRPDRCWNSPTARCWRTPWKAGGRFEQSVGIRSWDQASGVGTSN